MRRRRFRFREINFLRAKVFSEYFDRLKNVHQRVKISAEDLEKLAIALRETKPFDYIVQNLEKTFGEPKSLRRSDPLAMLIKIILSQATNDQNSRRTYRQLKDSFKNWEELQTASENEIAEAIKSGGLANQKARVIKNLLTEIKEKQDKVSLDFLTDLSKEKAREYLQNFRGIGPKTVACTLLFACQTDIFPLDTHIFRILKRMGILPTKISDEKAHRLLDRLVPEKKFYSFHINLIKLGKNICRPQNPLCEKCPVVEYCDYGLTQI